MSSSALVVALVLGLATIACGSGESTQGVAGSDGAPAASQTVGPEDDGAASVPNPWNVIVITLDTTRADALGVYGQPLPTTPILDAIAADGVLFETAYTASPSTLPSHSTIFTGRLPFEHGVRSNAGYRLVDENETLAEILEGHGYATAAEIAAVVLAKGRGVDQGFESYRDPMSVGVRKKEVLVRLEDGSLQKESIELPERDARDITKAGMSFIARTQEPFFLWLHYFDVHAFYAPPPSFAKRFRDSPYHSEVHFVDYQVGLLFSMLRTTGLRERTLVIVTADHGEGLDEHEETTHSFFTYDTTMRVPLIFWGPDEVSGGRRIPGVVQTADVTPTVLDFLGLSSDQTMSGISLRSAIGQGRAGDGPAYGESLEPTAMFDSSALRFLRLGRWKYFHKLRPELFDIEADPGELVNLADEHPEELAALRAKMEEALRSAPEPPQARVAVSEEEWAMLNALGYVGGAASKDYNDLSDFADLRGPDPADAVKDLKLYAGAWGEYKIDEHEASLAMFEELLVAHPRSVPLLRGQAASLIALERHAEAAESMRRALEVDPEDSAMRQQRVHQLTMAGSYDVALREGEALLAGDACNTLAVALYSDVLGKSGRLIEKAAYLEQAIQECPENLDIQNEYAYLLATAPTEPPRNPGRATAIARKIVKETNRERGDFLDTLACAQAASGSTKIAVRNARRALELLRRQAHQPTIDAVEAHLELFRAGKAVVEDPDRTALTLPLR